MIIHLYKNLHQTRPQRAKCVHQYKPRLYNYREHQCHRVWKRDIVTATVFHSRSIHTTAEIWLCLIRCRILSETEKIRTLPFMYPSQETFEVNPDIGSVCTWVHKIVFCLRERTIIRIDFLKNKLKTKYGFLFRPQIYFRRSKNFINKNIWSWDLKTHK